jgi:protein-S-isoprenylcysteine O-methyltransferase Ste14
VSAWHTTYAAVGVLLLLIRAFVVVAIGYADTFRRPNVVRLTAACIIALGVGSRLYAAHSIPNWSTNGPDQKREFNAALTNQPAYDGLISNTAGCGCYVLVVPGIAIVALVPTRGRRGARGA